MNARQLDLFEPVRSLPEGFDYRTDVVSPDREAELIARFAELEFREYEFHGYLGKRRVVSFGPGYEFAHTTPRKATEIPAFLVPLRDIAADFAGVAPAELAHALISEYAPGAGIGWHRDRPVYRDVVGISFGSPCRFRLRRKHRNSWERAFLIVEPRSAYLLRGPARTEWQHSIPPGDELRYSVTFRSLNERS
jgi:alkylated DNA repair dioxygenase AlkB